MAKRDVELILKAKDQASQLIEKVTRALEEFQGAEKRAGESSGDFAKRLRALKTALKDFEASAGGEGFRKLEQDVRRAKSAFADMQAEAERLNAKVDRLSKAAVEAAQHENRMAVEYERATEALRRQKAVLADAVASSKAIAEAKRQELAAQNKAARAAEARDRQLRKANAELEKARQRWRELAREISNSASVTKKTAAAYSAAEKRVRRKAEAVRKLASEYRESRAATTRAKEALSRLEAEYSSATAKVKQYERSVQEAKDRQKLFAEASREAAASFSRINGELNRARSAYAAQREEIARTRASLSEMTQALQRSGAAYKTAAQQAEAAMARIVSEQKRAAQSAFTDWGRAEQAVAKYQAQLAKSNVAKAFLGGQEQINRKLAEAKARAEEARARYERLNGSVKRLGEVMRKSATDTASVAAKLDAFDRAMRAADAETRKLADSQKRASVEVQRLGKSMQQASGFTNRFRANLRQLGVDSRKALSYTQRLRGQVLALIAAYGGFQAVTGVLRGVTSAYREWAAAQRSVSVAMDTLDSATITQEMEYIRATANRLGVDLETTAREYSRLAVATRGTNITLEETRKIFEAVSGASRVMGLDTERTKRVFTALVQIASKGKIQMEELRQQLGDNLPGAIKLMAEAAGYGKDSMEEFYKAIQRGEVDAKMLVNFAEKLNEYFGPQLSKAIEDNTAWLARFKNAMFELALFVGKSGVLDALTRLYQTIVQVTKSTDFREFIAVVSKGFALMIDGLSAAIKYWKVLITVLGVFVALRIGRVISAAALALTEMTAATRGAAMATTLLTAAQTRLNAAQAAGMALGGRLKGLFVGFLGTISRLHPALLAITVALGALWLAWKKLGPAAKEAEQGTDKLSATAQKAGKSLGAASEEAKKLVDGISSQDIDSATEQLKQYGASAEYVRRMAGEIQFRLNVQETGSTTLQEAADAIDGMASAVDRLNNVGTTGLGAIKDAARELTDNLRSMSEEIRGLVDGGALSPEAFLPLTEGLQPLSETAGTLAAHFESVSASLEQLAGSSISVDDLVLSLNALADGATAAANGMDSFSSSMESAGTNVSSSSEAFLDAARKAAELRSELEALSEYADLKLDIRAEVSGTDDVRRLTEAVRELKATLEGLDEISDRAFGGLNEALADASDSLAGTAKAAKAVSRVFANIRKETQKLRQEFARLDFPVDRIDEFHEKLSGLNDLIREAEGVVEDYNASLRDLSSSVEGVVSAAANAENALRQYVDYLGNAAGRVRDAAEIFGELTDAIRTQRLEFQQLADTVRTVEKRFSDARDAAEEYYRSVAKNSGGGPSSSTGQNISTGYTNTFHTGGIVGSRMAPSGGNARRVVDMNAFSGAYHYATGGLAGFKPDEVPAILHRGEEVITINDPRHRRNLRTGLTQPQQVTFDASGLEKAGAAFAASALLGSQAVQISLEQAADYFYQQVVLASKWLVGSIDGLRKGLEASFNSMIAAVDRVLSSAKSSASSSGGKGDSFRDALKRQFEESVLRDNRNLLAKLSGFLPAHAGGVVSSAGTISSSSPYAPRVVNPAVFAGARRFHSGGLPGLAADEVPAILQKGEEVLSRNDPRNVLNSGRNSGTTSGAAPVNLKIINTIDPGEVLAEGLSTAEGEEAIMNFFGENSEAIQRRIG